jgi:hypothetical protein
LVAALTASAGAASPGDASPSALAQVEALNANLLSHDSATETL